MEQANYTDRIGYKLHKAIESINFYSNLAILSFGVVANFLIIYLLQTKSKSKFRTSQASVKKSSPELYMLALAISDIIFLISYLISESAPLVESKAAIFKLMENYNQVCKTVHFLKSSTRFCSSYLVVCFAYERFSVVRKPFIRFKSRLLTKVNVIYCMKMFQHSITIINWLWPSLNDSEILLK